MRSRTEQFRMVHSLKGRAKHRCTEEGYRSLGRYYFGLVLRDIIAPQRHTFSAQIANLDWEEQDEVLDALLGMSPERLRETFLTVVRQTNNK